MPDEILPEMSAARLLAALAVHLSVFPKLDFCTTNVKLWDEPYVQIHPRHLGASYLVELCAWVESLGEPSDIEVTYYPEDDGGRAHLLVTGTLSDGTRMGVVCLPEPGESARILAAGGATKRDDTFPVSVLREVLAEAVAR